MTGGEEAVVHPESNGAGPDPHALPGAREARPREGGGQRGFSLLEVLIASMMSVLVVGGILVMLMGLQDVHRNQQELIDAQQTARLALEQMQRDLGMAGVGLASMLSPLPVVMPRDDGGVEIRHNQGGVTTYLIQDMSGTGSALSVDDASAFESGMTVAVYDATGTIDMVTLTSVDTAGDSLHHDGTSKAYTVANGTAVSRVQTVRYELQSVNTTLALRRQVDTDPAQPLARNVVSLNVTYFDDSVPPQPFTPTTVADELRIRAVELELTVQTENVRLNTDSNPTVTLTARVTPRAIRLST